jgi:hypothetical protein
MQDDFGDSVTVPGTLSIRARLDAGDQRMGRIEGDVAAVREELAENTRATKEVASNTAELVELFQSFKGAIKVLNWFGKLAKPMAYIVGLGTALLGFWTALKGR